MMSLNAHLLTIVVEDYFQTAPCVRYVQPSRWYRFEMRLERNTRLALDLLDEVGATATFFVNDWVARRQPEIVREIAARGHEVAARGLFHRRLSDIDRVRFRDEVAQCREVIERVTAIEVSGFRAHQWLRSPAELWGLNVLAEAGFKYDSSINPMFRRFAREPHRCVPHVHCDRSAQLWEFPVTTTSFLGMRWPIGGGNYFRQVPYPVLKRAIDAWHRASTEPFVTYFHVWELDPDQPKIVGVSRLQRIRLYRNLDRMVHVLRDHLPRYNFTGIAEYLGLHTVDSSFALPRADRQETSCDELESIHGTVSIASDSAARPKSAGPRIGRPRITIVVPCHNESSTIPYLARTLHEVEDLLETEYEMHFVFVDDGSSDNSREALRLAFGDRSNCRIICHATNRGVARAIMTGVREATTDIVCSIDADCTYDPRQLKNMIPMLTSEVDVVTASPYHSRGLVVNVPGWRLWLSKTLSALYRRVLRQRLATYTSCFRVYRRRAIIDLKLSENGFLGVAEIIGLLDRNGQTVVECPAVLESRVLGYSKMRTMSTIIGHCRLLVRFVLMGRRPASSLRGSGAAKTVEASRTTSLNT